ncbi:MAG: hypothetical protein L6R40_007726 [Gallowayella cf. fulva]|nr:MAG: hypothetical protein L6R40_007726 [Xanthomendoza cf. fulva]
MTKQVPITTTDNPDTIKPSPYPKSLTPQLTMTTQERTLAISPIVTDSVAHNASTLSNIRSLTSSLFGIASGILGLESYAGFLFYLAGTLLVSLLVWAILCRREAGRFFQSPGADLWAGEVVGGLSSFVLTWTLFYGLVRA